MFSVSIRPPHRGAASDFLSRGLASRFVRLKFPAAGSVSPPNPLAGFTVGRSLTSEDRQSLRTGHAPAPAPASCAYRMGQSAKWPNRLCCIGHPLASPSEGLFCFSRHRLSFFQSRALHTSPFVTAGRLSARAIRRSLTRRSSGRTTDLVDLRNLRKFPVFRTTEKHQASGHEYGKHARFGHILRHEGGAFCIFQRYGE